MKGGSGTGPTKTLDERGLAEGGQRWRFVPLRDRLSSTSARPAALPTVDYSLNLEGVAADDTTFSHFSASLEQQSEENCTAAFVNYVTSVKPLSLSLPLVYRNRAKIIDLSLKAIQASVVHSGADAVRSISACLTALSIDLGPSGFIQYFPRIVADFANILSAGHQNNAVSKSTHEHATAANSKDSRSPLDQNDSKGQGHSLFWQPEDILVPIFASLSDFTKLMISHLLQAPTKTVTDLGPLLSHSHYRIREMTGESCLGYLIRKARDSSIREAFVRTVIRAPFESDLTSRFPLALVTDGLGIALFEGVRLPSGRLHSRGKDVLRVALLALSQHNTPKSHDAGLISIVDGTGPGIVNSDTSDTGLLILSRCFASISRHTTNPNDIHSLASLFAEEFNLAVSGNDCSRMSNVLFLIRKWLYHGGRNVNVVLGPALCQRFVNNAVRAVESHCSEVRLVCEAICTLSSLHHHSSETFREKSVLRAFVTVLELIAKVDDVGLLSAALNVILDVHVVEFDATQKRTLARCVAAVCDKIASVSIPASFHSDESGVPTSHRVIALAFALRFLRTMGSIYASRLPVVKFSIPGLESFVLSTLIKGLDTSNANDRSFPRGLELESLLFGALEYMAYVEIEGSARVLMRIRNSEKFETPVAFALFLSACARQGKGSMDEASTILEIVATLLRNPRLIQKELWSSEIYCACVSRCIEAFGFEKIFGNPDEEGNDSSSSVLLVANQVLVKNLSSENSGLRKSSLLLLSKLGVGEAGEETGLGSRRTIDNGIPLQESLQMLRSTFSSEISVRSLCAPLLTIVHVNRALEGIGSCVVLLQELMRLFGQVKVVKAEIVFFLTHFALGVIQTPLKVLWKHAGDLLKVLAIRDRDIVMSCTVAYLRRCEMVVRNQITASVEEESQEYNDSKEARSEVNKAETERDATEEEDDSASVYDEGAMDEVDDRSITTKLPAKRPRSLHKIVSKRQRANNREFKNLHWDPLEWIGFRDVSPAKLCFDKNMGNWQSSKFVEGSTDLITVIMELCRSLSKDPKIALRFKADFVSLYLGLPPAMFPRRKGNLLVSSILSLLEKMGGLKCCESDKDKELMMRERLLSDLTRPALGLQEAALKCLCVSRVGSVKQHWNSLFRLIDDKTFREELTLMTENLFTDGSEVNGHQHSEDQMEVMDVVVRICFSKIVAGRGSSQSRRSALFSFLSSKLGSPIFMSRFTSLLLQPIKGHMDDVDHSNSVVVFKPGTLPSRSFQIGLLKSLDGFATFCRRVIPTDCWQEICLAVKLIFSRAETGSDGQVIRATSLRLLSSLINLRADDTSFIITNILLIAKASIGSSGGKGASGTPALLEFLTSSLTLLPPDNVDSLLDTHLWIVRYCVEVILSPSIDCEAVDLSCDIMQRYLAYVGRRMESERSDEMHRKLVLNTPDALLQLVSRLTHVMAGKFSVQKKWSPVFEKSLKTVRCMIDVWPDSYNTLSRMVEPLVSYLLNQSFGRISSPVLSTLCSIATSRSARSYTGNDSTLDVSQVLHLLSLRRFTQNDESYTSLCILIGKIGGSDLAAVSNILRDLKAMSRKRLEEPDLDRRIEALNKVSKMFLTALGGSDRGLSSDARDVIVETDGSVEGPGCLISLSPNAVLALCHGCMVSVWTKDTAIRGTAGYSLRLIARWVAVSDTIAARRCRTAVFNLLLHQLVACKDTIHRREFSFAFGELVRSCAGLSGDESGDKDSHLLHMYLKKICNANDFELDFFENLVHLQAHRRSRALRQLERHLQEVDSLSVDMDKHFSRGLVADLFVLPLAMKVALERVDVESKRHRNTKHISNEDNQRDIASWAVKLVGTTALYLPWRKYKTCLDGLLKILSVQNDADECLIIYKLVVAVAEAFPKQEEERYPDGSTARDYLLDTLIPNMLLHVSSGAVTEDLLHAREKPTNRFVEVGNRNEKSQSMFRAPVAIAIGVLMARLPDEKLESMISLLITPLTSALRSRMVSTRESAKLALTSVVLALGPKYLSYILREVLSVLNEGYRKDSCVYVVHALLQGIRKYRAGKGIDGKQKEFDVVGCLDIVTDLVLSELKNGASDTRKDFEDPNTSDTRIKQANARASKAGDCVELISELVPFNLCAQRLCTSITDSLAQTLSGKLTSKLNELLRRLLNGFSKNSSMSPSDAFKLCYILIADENSKGGNFSQQEMGRNLGKLKNCLSLKPFSSTNFGFQLLNFVLGKYTNILTASSEDASLLRSMAQPFLPISVGAMKSGKDELTLAAFRVLQKLLRLPLAHKDIVAEEMMRTISNVLSEHSGGVGEDYSVTGDLFNTCLRAAAVMFKEIDTSELLSISKDRVDTILTISCNCVESGSLECRAAAVASLRAIVSAKILLPSVYDSIERVNQLAIHSQSSALSRACISLSVLFFITYPLGAERFRQHLDFFVRNLSYELPSGRISALETIMEIILKVPAPVLEAESEYLFLSLTANIARDCDNVCRELASECVRLMFEQIPTGGKIVDLLKAGVALIGVECSMTNLDAPPTLRGKVDLKVVNCGAASLTAACRSKRLTLLQLKLVLWSIIVAIQNLSDDEGWETWYMLFQCVEVIFEQQTDGLPEMQRLETANILCRLWKKIGMFLLHRNQQVRFIASRLVGRHLSACGGRNGKPIQNKGGDLWSVWNDNEVIREWIKAFCLQLEADQLAIELGQQCLKNVTCMADVIRKHPSAGDIGDQKVLLDDIYEDENRLVKRDEFLIETEKETAMNESRMLRWVLSRFCGLATKGGRDPRDFLRRACALRFLLVTAKWWGKEMVVEFKKHYILPVVLVLESGELHRHEMARRDEGENSLRTSRRWKTVKENSQIKNENEVGWKSLKVIAEGLQATLTECIGSVEYYEVYHVLQTKRTAAKLERKRKAAVLAAVDPERTAKRKRAKVALKRLRRRGVNATNARKKLGLSATRMKPEVDSTVDTLTQDQIEKRQLTEDI